MKKLETIQEFYHDRYEWIPQEIRNGLGHFNVFSLDPYIGEAWLNGLLEADGEVNYNITKATFKANSTLDWHKHSSAQVLIYVDGEGYYQERGEEPVILKAGDIIKCEKDTEHWHSSTKESDVTYLALYGCEQPTTWTEVLTQEYYDSVAEKLKKKASKQ